ncbi:MotE family protein [Bacillus benzoevorans]|uniref:Flagellar motility protein MotE (MotC chaperone) n=1 Tax=Bacillus benzoevorans TaxID=1456 RepID=A0A7X0LTW4_9BACI|nr:MotE family protein [Bacillus benzoevorans]MBB6443845.1 flagellar motility protein MotE (MotC chaperone) [Bacillus benzoevorans]
MEEKLQEEAEEKYYSKLQWFFMVIIIPSIFALAVALIVATVAGVNVVDKAKEYSEHIPFLSSGKHGDEKKIEIVEQQLTELRAEIKVKESSIAELQAKVDTKDRQIEKLELERKQLEKEIDSLVAIQTENKREFKDIVKTYETMSAKKAAPIITQMNDKEALEILSQLTSDTLAAIMEQMIPAQAAKYTSLLSQNSDKNVE